MLRILIILLWGLTLIPGSDAGGSWSCSVPHNTTMVPNIALAEAQYGSASYIQGNLAEPWPIVTHPDDGRRLRTVRYCFADQKARDLLWCRVMRAFSLWAKGLGAPASAATGHSVGWEEAHDGNPDRRLRQRQFCYRDLSFIGLDRVWNDAVKEDTLVIYAVTDSSVSSATVGYNSFDGAKHTMTLGSHASIPVIAHEIGHVFGMIHEQSRNDRDDHVLYRCNKIAGYDTALTRAMNEGHSRDEAHRLLCEDQDFALKHSFNGAQYIKNDQLGTQPGRWGDLDEPSGFDIKSIMLYSSYSFSNTDACSADSNECPLVEVHRGKDNNVIGTSHIPLPVGPSEGDIAWVKKRYPWNPDANQ